MNASGQSVWENCLVYIKDNIQDQAYKTWFEPIVPVKLENKVLSIQVPSKFFLFIFQFIFCVAISIFI